MIDRINNNLQIVLGSASPRRKHLLEEIGLQFISEIHPIEESYPEHLTPYEISEHIAQQKASAFQQPENNKLIITADTVVAFRNSILGKPADAKEAFEMLRLLSNNTHEVITGICLRNATGTHTFHAITKVTFDRIDNETIYQYINKSKPFDKAGAYGIQEWFGMIAVKHIEGSYFNVMGLPVQQLIQKITQIINI